MLVSSVILFIFIAILTYVAKEYLYPNHPASLPPMPSRPLPIVGHVLEFAFEPPTIVFAKWRKKVGSIYSIYLGSKLYIMVTDYQSIRELFMKRNEVVAERADLHVVKAMSDPHTGMNGIVGQGWREQRAVTLNILREFGMGKELMADRLVEEVKACLKVLSDFKGEANDIQPLFHNAVSNVIFSVLVGHRYEYGDPYYKEILDLLIEQLILVNQAPLVDVFGWLQYLPTSIFKGNKLQPNTLYFHRFFKGYIDKYRNNPDDESPDSFIKAYLREKEKLEANGKTCPLTDDDLVSIAYVLLFAGSESTSTTLVWCLVYGMNYPECQKKMYEEIKEVVGTDRLPRLHDRKQLHYLLAFIAEIQRVTNILPVGFPRHCAKTVQLGGYTLPEGAFISPVLEGVFLDEGLWGDPHVFRPERFIDDKGLFSSPDYQIPFFIGKRSCPGEALAIVELFFFLTTIIQRFEVLPESPDRLPSLKPDLSACSAPFPFRARFIERA